MNPQFAAPGKNFPVAKTKRAPHGRSFSFFLDLADDFLSPALFPGYGVGIASGQSAGLASLEVVFLEDGDLDGGQQAVGLVEQISGGDLHIPGIGIGHAHRDLRFLQDGGHLREPVPEAVHRRAGRQIRIQQEAAGADDLRAGRLIAAGDIAQLADQLQRNAGFVHQRAAVEDGDARGFRLRGAGVDGGIAGRDSAECHGGLRVHRGEFGGEVMRGVGDVGWGGDSGHLLIPRGGLMAPTGSGGRDVKTRLTNVRPSSRIGPSRPQIGIRERSR